MSNLKRFLDAQEKDYKNALAEIRRGRKTGHWMWYIFPQLKDSGYSPTSKFYGIHGIEEAKEYMEHPVLGFRLREISSALLALESNDALQIMGSPDHLKLKSSMTLLSSIPGADLVFGKVIEKFFSGEKDKKTLAIIKNKEA
ncbi:DUF1810 domain-containing protein [Antarcticibacterium arcticum]|uniref:DUF1810 domain-containing protein n=1 Tax=Antarcticibacterium arcticum TaxID=2585771 RepID=A0A5B8YFE0_9FLAO|nr:DUF1810 domain-containing protein [Antarcticibacterium arcticum]QED36692.1 DUF1810 domain-containing protein [Antarcticibacterium arcticum]